MEEKPDIEEPVGISEYINKMLIKYRNHMIIFPDIINLILIFDNVRDANPIISKNFVVISDIAKFLNNYILDEIIFLEHYVGENFTVTKKRNMKKVDRILKLFLYDDKTEAHSQYGEILGYYCYNQNWSNKEICRVQMQIVNENGIQITTEVCEFNIFKEEYEDHLGFFITKLNNWKDTMNKYEINCELDGIITFWIVRNCKDEVDEFLSNNIEFIQNLGLAVKTKIISKDGKRSKRKSKRKSKKRR
jgi:hypothetical protein